jgi:3-hydroxyacyl-[acyl-carrier-protein] dehydratase
MSNDKVYSIGAPRRTDDGKVHVEVIFDPSHPVFLGHFPEKKIVPGVCMIRLIREIAEAEAGRTLRLVKGDNIKFVSVVEPSADTAMLLDFASSIDEQGGMIAKAELSYGGKTHMKFSGRFE